MNNQTILIYYIYALIVIILSGYVIFILDFSGWWSLLTLVLLNISPTADNNQL
jgi:hypothetical protein